MHCRRGSRFFQVLRPPRRSVPLHPPHAMPLPQAIRRRTAVHSGTKNTDKHPNLLFFPPHLSHAAIESPLDSARPHSTQMQQLVRRWPSLYAYSLQSSWRTSSRSTTSTSTSPTRPPRIPSPSPHTTNRRPVAPLADRSAPRVGTPAQKTPRPRGIRSEGYNDRKNILPWACQGTGRFHHSWPPR